MILQKKTINNVPTLVPLTADTGSGVPVGTIIGQYKKVNMAGYLYLDGSTFDQTLYPALYAYLGTNVLPDYREFVLVGAEQNTTSSVINQANHNHDVFTQGEEKDDQVQNHAHYLETSNQGHTNTFFDSSGGIGSTLASLQYTGAPIGAPEFRAGEFIEGRHGTTTRTKEKAVFWYIKATTGIIESEATEMLNVINENNSYSLNEIATGKTWIDGKPIYRKVVNFGVLPDFTTKSVPHGISNLSAIISMEGMTWGDDINTVALQLPHVDPNDLASGINLYMNGTNVAIQTGAVRSSYKNCYIIIEYTKTTD